MPASLLLVPKSDILTTPLEKETLHAEDTKLKYNYAEMARAVV